MITLKQLNSWDELPPLSPVQAVQLEPNDALLNPPADACWVATDGASALARCSLWFENTGRLDGFRRPGAIGHFASADEAASEALLQKAVEQLRDAGCDAAVGPLDQNTWHRYRFITERGTEPVFTMEPDNDDAWPDHFRAAGFQTLATYCSYLVEELTCRSEKLVRVAERLEQAGIRIRPIDLDRYEQELKAIHRMSLISFSSNFLYSSLDAESFVKMYAPYRQALHPDLVQLAEDASGRLVGYLFGIIDPKTAADERGPTAIVKTLAVLPEKQCAGLGGLLLEQGHLAAHRLGCRRAIHALMHDQNRSVNLARRYGRRFRTYGLFAKDLRD